MIFVYFGQIQINYLNINLVITEHGIGSLIFIKRMLKINEFIIWWWKLFRAKNQTAKDSPGLIITFVVVTWEFIHNFILSFSGLCCVSRFAKCYFVSECKVVGLRKHFVKTSNRKMYIYGELYETGALAEAKIVRLY